MLRAVSACACALALTGADLRAQSPLDLVRAEQDRAVAMIERVAPAVVAIYDVGQHGGGSGILIDSEGYGITNHHVVAGFLNTRRGLGGLSDGRLYTLEVLGIDPIGDVAMFRLTGKETFPFAALGDSDLVRVGDVAFAMGNPFNISEDHAPSISRGIVTGVNRYQWGTRGLLIYSDCIQTDAPINPGNSGGPLVNSRGEVIGINGRISVNTRGRLNVGFGYAIASNQVRRFLPALRAGLLATHGTLQATVEESDSGVRFAVIRSEKSADRAGIQSGDRLLAIDGLSVESANRMASLAGTYPGGWQVLVDIERAGWRRLLTAELDPITPKLQHPFVPDPWNAARYAYRILRDHQAVRFLGDPANVPKRVQWLTHRHHEGANAPAHPVECFENIISSDGFLRVQPLTAKGQPARQVIEVTAGKAVLRRPENDEPLELTVDQQMLHAALHLVHVALLAPLDTFDIWTVKPAGGNVLYRPAKIHAAPSLAEPRSASAARIRRKYGWSARPVELLDWPLHEGLAAQLAFDTDTHDLLRVTVRDIPTAARVVVDVLDYEDALGLRRPARLRISGPNLEYTDRLTDWEETP